MRDLPFTSVIVPVYTGIVHLANCVRALQEQSYAKDLYEILIVDNGSQSGLHRILSGEQNVRILYEEFPSSYAARNRGILEAKGKVLAFTDVDCIPDRDWLTKGVHMLYSDPDNPGFVGGRVEVFAANPTRLTWVELFETVEAFNQEKYIKQWGFAATANLFAPKELFEKVGLFDPELKSSGDRDWGNRVTQAGYRGKYCKDAVVRHAARASFRDFFRKCARIQGGLFDLHKRDVGLSGFRSFRELWKSWPNQSDVRNLFQNKKHSPTVKAKLVFLYLLYKMSRSVELIRLLYGGVSKRA